MSLSTLATSLKNLFNNGSPGALPDMFRKIKIGNVLRSLETYLYQQAPAASVYTLNTYQAIALPEDAKARVLGTAYARAGGVTGPLTVATFASGTHPATGEISVGPNGDIVTLASDAITSLDVAYAPVKLDVVEVTLPVVPGTGVCALPVAAGQVAGPGAVLLMEAESMTGGVVGKSIVDIPTNSAPGTSAHASLNVAKTSVLFKVSDAVTSARVKLGIIPGTDLNALLEAADTFI